ncbi:hypothetical protein FRC01_011611, partial [Tulasnella sp. 417]
FVKDVLGSNPDIFLLVGHMSISDKDNKWDNLHAAIRKPHPKTPIFIFGGRYLETVGWVSASLADDTKPLNLVRRYLDPNKDTLLRHSGVDKESFDTKIGKEFMQSFNELAEERGLDELYGCAPQTYNWNHQKYSKHAKDHVLNFYMNEVFPAVINTKDTTTGQPNPYFLLLNNGFIRGPIYKGEFTKDDKFVNTPYSQRFSYISLPRLISERVLEMIDNFQEKVDDAVTGFDTVHGSDAGQTVYSADGEEMPLTLGRYVRKEIVGKLTTTSPGYVTSGSCMQLGPEDDTTHSSPSLEIQYPPTYVHSRSPTIETLGKYHLVDLVILHRRQDRVQDVVNAAIKMHNEFCEEKWRL